MFFRTLFPGGRRNLIPVIAVSLPAFRILTGSNLKQTIIKEKAEISCTYPGAKLKNPFTNTVLHNFEPGLSTLYEIFQIQQRTLFLKKNFCMKAKRLCTLVFSISVISNLIFSQEAVDLQSKISGTKLSTKEDSLTYALAVLSCYSWMKDNINPDPVIFAKAIYETKNGNPLISDEVARNFIMKYVNERQAMQAEMARKTYRDYISANEAFLANNKMKQGIIVTPSGLQYEVIKMGTGPKPTKANTVKVHYTGTLIDGTEFDSSVKRNTPAQFPVTGVIAGWTEALQLMPVGSKFRLFIPENLGYGSKGAGDKIKPFSALIFEVELLEIVN